MVLRISRNKSIFVAAMAVVFVLLLGISPQVVAFTSGEAANIVIGQSSYTTSAANSGNAGPVADGISGARDIAFDSHGDLWVADTDNNRVLEFVPGEGGCSSGVLCSGMSASLVIGQRNLTSNAINEGLTDGADNSSSLYQPYAVGFDSNGNLWVVDSGNNRVLEFTYPFSTGEAASIVIGQYSFTVHTADEGGDVNSSDLSGPTALAFSSNGNLWIADRYNSRVLEFETPFSTNEQASIVVGQSNFDTGTPGYLTATGLYEPYGLAFAPNGGLWVDDSDNGRVVGYPTPITTGEAATVVLSDDSFTTDSGSICYPSDINASSLCGSEGMSFDSSGDLWVADTYNNRVLEFVPGSGSCPTDELCDNMAASLVIGQSSFTDGAGATSQTGINHPYDVTFDSSGNLWVSDYDNNRVTEYLSSTSTGTTSTTTSTTSSSTTSTTSSSTTSTTSTTSSISSTSTTTTTTTTTTISTSTISSSTGPITPPQPANPCYAVTACYTTFATFDVVSASGGPVGGATVVISATGYQSQSGTTSSTPSTSALCTANPTWTAEWGAYWGCDAGSTTPFTLVVGVTYSYTVTLASGTVLTGSIGPSTTPGTAAWTITVVTVTT